jgi:predicted esterase
LSWPTVHFLGTTPAYSATTIQKFSMQYQVKRQDQTVASASAVVYIPEGDYTAPVPVIVYGAGTTGLANRCAPSNENPLKPTLGNYENQMISQAAQGSVVVMPNYLGFDTAQQLQHYFIAKKEATSLLSSALALFTIYDQQPNTPPIQANHIFLAGYSQGGHSAFAAADFQEEMTPEIRISGIIGHGPTPNVSHVLRLNPNLAPYITTAYANSYDDFEPEKIINQSYLDSLNEAERICADEGFGYSSVTPTQMYNQDFLTVNQTFPEEGKRFEENNVGLRFDNIPVFLAQGTIDPIVTLDDQAQFVEELCQKQIPVQFQIYPEQNHFNIRQISFADTQQWIAQIVQGEQPTNCG